MSIQGIREIDFEQAYLGKAIPEDKSDKYIAKDFVLELGGVKIKLKASDSLRDVVRKINLQSHVTGVRAKAINGRLALESTTKGRSQPSGITLPKKDSGEGFPVNANQIIGNYLHVIQNQTELVLQPQGTIDSKVVHNDLNPAQQSLYDIMMLASGLKTNDTGNLYVIRQAQYDEVAGIINLNQGANIGTINNLIDQRNDLNFETKEKYKETARLILEFDGVVQDPELQGGQQGMGGGKGPRDITSVASLERLRADYGILDGRKAIYIAKQFIITLMRENIPGIDIDPGVDALAHSNTLPTQRYQDAANQYLTACIVPEDEIVGDRDARLQRKRDAKVIIDDETKSSLTAVNNSMAAYRALIRMEQELNGLYTEKVTGRYNDKEILAYVILANLDVREVQKNLLAINVPLTPANIFNRQKENIEELISRLGFSQRTYNLDHIHGAIDVGGVDNAVGGLRGVDDSLSCPHGLCVRMVDSALHHSKVVLSDASPASFANEFNQAVMYKANRLPFVQRQEIKAWQDNLQGNVAVNYVGNQVIFSTPIIQGGNSVDIPVFYKQILSEAAIEMDNRYNFTHVNPKTQLVKQGAVTEIFTNAHFIGIHHGQD